MPIPAIVWTIGFYLVTTALSYALSRRAAGRVSNPDPPQAGQLEVPDARETGPVPVVFGTCWIAPNVCWYGDLKTVPIRRCEQGQCYTSGYRYLGGVHHVICCSPVDAVMELQADQRTAWLGPAGNGFYHVNVPNLFGGDDGQGGIDGWFQIALGEATQTASSYLAYQLGRVDTDGIVLQIRSESLPAAWELIECRGALNGASRVDSIFLEDADWHDLEGEWDRFTQIAWQSGVEPASDIVVRRKDTGAEIARLPVGTLSIPADWTYTHPRTPAIVPAFRGVVSCIFSQTLLSANSPFWPAMRWKVQRTREYSLWFTGAQNIAGAMNPAHILRELVCSAPWGRQYGSAALDDAAWRQSAQTLYDEQMGLNLVWDSGTIEEMAQVVLDHCDGRLYIHPRTGLWVFDLIRGDYVWGELPVLDEASIVSVESYERGAWDETVNEVVVTYMDQYTAKEGRVTVQNPANIAIQGAVVSATRDYPGIGTQALARRIALRDLKVLSRPAARCTVILNRLGWEWVPGQVLRLQWPDYGLVDVAYRLVEIDHGTLTDAHIRVDLVEDVFGLGRDRFTLAATQDDEEGTSEEQDAPDEPDLTPIACEDQYATEAPYWVLAHRLSALELAAVPEESGYGLVCALRPNDRHFDYALYADGAALGLRGAFTPSVLLASAISPADRTLSVVEWSGQSEITLGDWALIESNGDAPEEIIRIDTIEDEWIYVARGILDTVQHAHPAGARIWFVGARHAADLTERTDADEVEYVALPRTGAGEVAFDDADACTLTLASRAARPYPPGKVQINGEARPASLAGDLTITWAHRDRTQQTATLIRQGEASIGPEEGVTYSLTIYDGEGTTPLRSWTGLTGTSQEYTQAQMLADFGAIAVYPVRFELWSVRDGLESWQRQERAVAVDAD